jgi:SAM-dependent methyltransferase
LIRNGALAGSHQHDSFDQRLELVRSLEASHFWFRGRRELLRRLLRRFITRPGARVLDVGSGTGFFMSELEQEGFHAIGIDPLAAQPPGRAVRGDGLRLPFRQASFGGITMLDVLEHVDDATLLREASRVLQPDGVALITVPASNRLWSSRDVAAGHLRRYSKASLSNALAEAGLAPLFVTYYQFFLFPLLVVARTAGRRSQAVRVAEERPGALVNWLFGTLNVLEARFAPRVRWPWGSSLVAVCTKR